MLLVQGRGEMAVLPAVTAVLLHHSAIDISTPCIQDVTGGKDQTSGGCSLC